MKLARTKKERKWRGKNSLDFRSERWIKEAEGGRGEKGKIADFAILYSSVGHRSADVALAANKLHRRAVLC